MEEQEQEQQQRAEAEIRAAWQHGATATSYAPLERLQSYGALQRQKHNLEARTKKQHYMSCLAVAMCRHELPRRARSRSKTKQEVTAHLYSQPMVSSVLVLVAAGLSFNLALRSRTMTA